jgi:hypothetical protein
MFEELDFFDLEASFSHLFGFTALHLLDMVPPISVI